MSNGYPPQQPYPYPQPMFYPMPTGGGRNWAALIAGLAALGIGAYAVYWLWENGYFGGGCKSDGECPTGYVCDNGECVEGCTDNSDCPTGYTCVDNKCIPGTPCDDDGDCPSGQHCYNHNCVQCYLDSHCPPNYKCLNNRCVPSYTPCTGLAWECLPGWTGLQRCDPRENLCRCTGSQWDLVEENSQICIDNIRHNECYSNPEHSAICYWTQGQGADLCEDIDESRGCPCSPTIECQEKYCCEEDNRCRDIPDGITTFYATNTNGLTCWKDGQYVWAEYHFDETGITGFHHPLAFNKITGLKVYLEGNQIGPWDGAFYRGYNYTGWKDIWDFGCAGLLCCIPSCNPVTPGDFTKSPTMPPWCMDSFLIGLASPAGPPNIRGVECKFSLL